MIIELCLLKEKINLFITRNENDKVRKDVPFKYNATFTPCISKTSNTLIDNAEDLDMVIPI